MPSSGRVNAEQRRIVAARARDCCEYCRSQSSYSTQSFSIEHIIPRDKGGATELHNLALACQGCNNHKHVKTEAPDPVNKVLVPLFHPRRQRWRDHFAWDDECRQIVGLTPTGRATVEALQLNRPSLINLRRVLTAMGEHPPAEPTDRLAAVSDLEAMSLPVGEPEEMERESVADPAELLP